MEGTFGLILQIIGGITLYFMGFWITLQIVRKIECDDEEGITYDTEFLMMFLFMWIFAWIIIIILAVKGLFSLPCKIKNLEKHILYIENNAKFKKSKGGKKKK